MSGPPPRSVPLAAVLAGGAATRLGGEKAAAKLAGRALVSYPLDALALAGIGAVVIAKPDSRLPALAASVVVEPAEPLHPLLGVVAALKHAGGRPALVVPCDTPFLTPMLLRVLASAETTTAVRSAGRAHPLIALYRPEHLDPLEEAVHAGTSATQALEGLDPEWIEAPERETFNINTPEDLARAEELLREPRQ